MFSRALRPPVWLVPLSAAAIYLASLSAIMADDARDTRLLVVVFLGFSFLAGLVLKRFTALLLPLSVIAIALIWFPNVDEEPLVAMVVGLVGGVFAARVYERTSNRPITVLSGNARTHRRPSLRQAAKVVASRERVDKALDYVRFRIDTFPHGIYQPVASLPAGSARRGSGSESRWDAMSPVLSQQCVESAVDIGACEGYFSIRLGEAGISTIALEGDPSIHRTALYAVRRSGLDNVGVLALNLTPQNVATIPPADATICLSIWHHFVRDHGLDEANRMLETIWERTDRVLFFDTGENEMTPEFGLPDMRPDALSWISAYLAQTCEGSRVEHLGRHEAFDPAGRTVERNLFAVIRV